MRLHPSRTRMEQYRVDVGHVCMGVLSLLPFACLHRPLDSHSIRLVDAIVEGLEALVCALALMAGPPLQVLGFSNDLDREAVVFTPRGASSAVSSDGMGVTLPASLLAWEGDFGVVSRSPKGPDGAPFDPILNSCMHDCVRDVSTNSGCYDDLRSLQLYSWPREVLQSPRLTRQQALMYISQRHELCDWEYPPLTSDEAAIRDRLVRFRHVH